MTGSSSKIIFEPLPYDDPQQRRPDISLAKDKLDWEPITSLVEGLKPTIGYFKNLLSNPVKDTSSVLPQVRRVV